MPSANVDVPPMYNSNHNNNSDIPWWLLINWTAFLAETFDPKSNMSTRPTEVACFRNMVRECRQFEWDNHTNNPKNKNY